MDRNYIQGGKEHLFEPHYFITAPLSSCSGRQVAYSGSDSFSGGSRLVEIVDCNDELVGSKARNPVRFNAEKARSHVILNLVTL